ncbi:Protein couch potato [Melipona quadrifasciata]|uniref:Protein couch potato n=1 Tax=Melipona quadrifasciata TaxID=166423 RepID=A0A0N0U6M6_9HYME|nr:Protein couch potato [Melipona quadrifasciata]
MKVVWNKFHRLTHFLHPKANITYTPPPNATRTSRTWNNAEKSVFFLFSFQAPMSLPHPTTLTSIHASLPHFLPSPALASPVGSPSSQPNIAVSNAPCSTLFVANLGQFVSEHELKDIFSRLEKLYRTIPQPFYDDFYRSRLPSRDRWSFEFDQVEQTYTGENENEKGGELAIAGGSCPGVSTKNIKNYEGKYISMLNLLLMAFNGYWKNYETSLSRIYQHYQRLERMFIFKPKIILCFLFKQRYPSRVNQEFQNIRITGLKVHAKVWQLIQSKIKLKSRAAKLDYYLHIQNETTDGRILLG